MTTQTRSITSVSNVAFSGNAWTFGGGFPATSNASRSGSAAFVTDFAYLVAAAFAIPTDATINTVTLNFDTKATASDSSDTALYSAFLARGSVAISNGDDVTVTGDGVAVPRALDGVGPNWGATLTPDIVNDPTFGVFITANWPKASAVTFTAQIDASTHVPAITVDYTAASPPPPPPPGTVRRGALFGTSF